MLDIRKIGYKLVSLHLFRLVQHWFNIVALYKYCSSIICVVVKASLRMLYYLYIVALDWLPIYIIYQSTNVNRVEDIKSKYHYLSIKKVVISNHSSQPCWMLLNSKKVEVI